ncbi:MAG TPA: hypothetical protein VM487_14270 [Phycisphaerae bacterium]|nr:hypothetical protein [Phycisphaerae bacterium]
MNDPGAWAAAIQSLRLELGLSGLGAVGVFFGWRLTVIWKARVEHPRPIVEREQIEAVVNEALDRRGYPPKASTRV